MHVAQDLQPWMRTTAQPVALAVGRVVRAISSSERLDASIKAAEVIARFVAVASLASAAAMKPRGADPPDVRNFAGPLSFGMFENALHVAAAVTWAHPLRDQVRVGVKSTKKRTAIAGQRIRQFVELRNELGHAITPADDARARILLERADPVGGLIEILGGLNYVLEYPLLVLLRQEHRHGRFLGRFAFFAGEGEPIPQALELREPLYEWETPYLCTPAGLIPLAPGLLYQPRASDGQFGLYILDGVAEEALRYKSVQESGSITRTEGLRELGDWMCLPFEVPGLPSRPLLESIACLDGRSLHGYLSGEAVPQPGGDEPSIASVREFEQRLDSMALGIAYRDVLYCLASHGARAELGGGGVRVVTTSEPTRVLATIEVTPGMSLRIVLLAGALTSRRRDVADEYELRAGESADRVVDQIASLLEVQEPMEAEDG